jgi:hypothetical protein
LVAIVAKCDLLSVIVILRDIGVGARERQVLVEGKKDEEAGSLKAEEQARSVLIPAPRQ